MLPFHILVLITPFQLYRYFLLVFTTAWLEDSEQSDYSSSFLSTSFTDSAFSLFQLKFHLHCSNATFHIAGSIPSRSVSVSSAHKAFFSSLLKPSSNSYIIHSQAPRLAISQPTPPNWQRPPYIWLDTTKCDRDYSGSGPISRTVSAILHHWH